MKTSLRRSFGQRVRTLREAKGLSQEALADRCRLDRTYVSGVERGRRNPSLESMDALAKGLGVTLAHLLSGVPEE